MTSLFSSDVRSACARWRANGVTPDLDEWNLMCGEAAMAREQIERGEAGGWSLEQALEASDVRQVIGEITERDVGVTKAGKEVRSGWPRWTPTGIRAVDMGRK